MTSTSAGSISLGDGIELRPLRPEHADEFLAHIDRGREFVGRFIRLPDLVTDAGSAHAFLSGYARQAEADTGRLDGIWADGLLVGGVLLRSMNVAEGVAEVGCRLEPAAVGRGLVTRGARALIRWAIEERGIHRVEWRVAPQNTASITVARRLGMRRDGVLRERYLHRDTRYDAEVWSPPRAPGGSGARRRRPPVRDHRRVHRDPGRVV
ncbi:GNAT family N-acetyltransferase [Pseudonocardia sp. CNS-004]|nr:GNAT family N-acetyltransferase [Pseudonocardia sp. CNS-004]